MGPASCESSGPRPGAALSAALGRMMITPHAQHGMALAAVALCLCLPAAPAAAGGDSPDPAALEFFEKKVRPVLVEHCFKCHSAQAKKLRGGLRLDSRAGVLTGGDNGPALVPGHPEKSRL